MRRLVVLLLVLLAACSTDPAPVDSAGEPQRSTAPKPTKTKTKKPAPVLGTVLVYVKGNTLHAYDLETGLDVEWRKLPGPDVTLSPNGTRLAVVIDKDPGGDPEGYGDPYIGVTDIFGQAELLELGPGRSPDWSNDGNAIAATLDDGVVTYDVTTGAAGEVLTGEGWTVVGWSNERVAAVGQGTTVLAGPGGKREELGYEPSEVWGVSPADETVARVGADGSSLVTDEDAVSVDVVGMADGAWSPDGSHIVVVEVADGPAHAVLVDTSTGQASEITEGKGAQGNVVWKSDSQTFAFVRVDPEDKLKLQAVVCETSGGCESAFSWDRGVMLLGFAAL